ncbi:MAG: AEC family transporter [Anaerolineae bacterium]|nr:AEC family transporter [Anaerolineae bacterium]
MSGFISIFLNVLGPVFLLLALGYYAAPRLGLEARTLSRVAYYIISPAFVLTILGSAKLEAQLTARMIGFITLTYLISMALAMLIAKLLNRPRSMIAAYAMIAVFGNVGNFGLPISQFAQGKEALIPGTVYFLANMVLGFVVCVAIAQLMKGGNPVQAALKVVKTPALLALPPALIINYFDIVLPPLITRPAELLTPALIPIMLITLGAQLAAAGIPKPDLDIVLSGVIRLVTGAVLSFALVGLFNLPLLERNVGILQASMPAAVLVSIIALENDVKPEFVTASVLLSNLLSAISLGVVLAFM